MNQADDLGFVFYPGSIAVAGATNAQAFAPGKRYVKSLLQAGYKGPIYPLNSSGEEVLGLKAYRSILDIPGTVDQVICCIPAPATPQLIRNSAARGARVVTLFTSGYSEDGSKDGKRLEKEIVAIGQERGVRILGPNCMGAVCPDSGMTFFTTEIARKGALGFLAQSGGNAHELMCMGALRGIGFSKIISYGNAADLNETDFLRYLTADKETRAIAMYLEGVKNGRAFARALRKAADAKPVIVLKGGRTRAGAQAASSHTGSLAANAEGWHILFRQAGVLTVSSMEEMADLALAFLHMPRPKGRRTGIITFGGGRGVVSSDQCEEAGLVVPRFPPGLSRQLGEFTPHAGTNVTNPVDSTVRVAINVPDYTRMLELVVGSESIDAAIVYMYADFFYADAPGLFQKHAAIAVETAHKFNKPVALVLSTSGGKRTTDMILEAQGIAAAGSLPSYPTVGRAAHSMGRFIRYYLEPDPAREGVNGPRRLVY